MKFVLNIMIFFNENEWIMVKKMYKSFELNGLCMKKMDLKNKWHETSAYEQVVK